MENRQIPQKSNNLDKPALISLSFELGYIIALPLVAFGFVGKWLDSRMGNEFPVMSLIGIGLAILSTVLWLIKRLKRYIK